MKKPVCLHHHIFKNAGTTIDWTLQKNFKKDALNLDDTSNPNTVISTQQLLQFLIENSEAKSISSHQLHPFAVPEDSDFQFLSIVFTRHPIDRAFSIYNFMQKEPHLDEYTVQAKNSSLKQFIQFNLESEAYMNMRNGQTRYLSYDFSEDLFSACYYLKKCTIVGIVERIDESLVFAEDVLRNYFPQIDLSYIKQNVSSNRIGYLTEKLEKARLEIGDELMNILIKSNNLDFHLYDYASKILNERTSNVNNFLGKLNDFKKRCRQLEKAGANRQLEKAVANKP